MSAYPNTKAWYISSARYAAVTAWATGATKTAGDIVRQNATPTRGNERCFICIAGGTTHATTEPTWNLTRGAKTTDNTVTWMEATGIAAFNGDKTNTTNWADMKAVASTIAIGHVIKDAAGTHLFICTTAGTVGSSEPSWDTSSLGSTTADGTVTWTYVGTSFTNWGAAQARLDNVTLNGWGGTSTQVEAGRDFYVGDDHAETQAASVTMGGGLGGNDSTAPARIICVDHAGSVPPVAADLKTTATITTTGSTSYSCLSYFYMYGITFNIGSSGSQNLDLNNDGKPKMYEKCKWTSASSGNAGPTIGSGGGVTELIDFEMKFSATGGWFQPQARVIWKGGKVDGTGSIPSKFINAGARCELQIRGVDLSALSGSTLFDPNFNTIPFLSCFEDCKMPASYTLATTGDYPSSGAGQRFRLARCQSGAHVDACEAGDSFGSHRNDYSVGRSGGAPSAWKFVTLAQASIGTPFMSMPFAKYNTTTGASVTATVYGIANAAAVPNTNELWLEIAYQADSGDPQTGRVNTRPDLLGSTALAGCTTDTSSWDSLATARANTHAYSVGDVIKVASNPGRIFFCTSAGTSAGSEPGGYASAVDGGSVTDSGATFRAGCRFKLSASFTPQLAGPIRATIRAGKPSVTTYVDPFLDLS